MAKTKRKILLVNEFSQLSTGYATYFRHILPYLHATGKYEFGEIAVFLSPGHPKKDQWLSTTPWKVYMNEPPADAPAEVHQAYRSDQHNQLGKFAFEPSLLDFKPDICCVPPETLVFTDRGYIPIEDVRVGDKTLTHKGRFQKVTETMRRQHDDKIVKIFVAGMPECIRLTPEHPVLIYRHKLATNRKDGTRSETYRNQVPEWVEAQNVKEQDIVLLNAIKNTKIDIEINTTDYLTKFFVRDNIVYPNNSATNGIPTKIPINQEFGRLVGYIIGDGHISENRSVSIAFGGEEQEFADDAVYLFKKYLGLEATIKPAKDRYMLTVYCNCSIAGHFFEQFLGYRTRTKHIPFPFFSSTKEAKEGIIQGLVRSDGCYKHNTVSLATINKQLAYDYRMICASVGLAVTIVFIPSAGLNGSYEVNAYGLNAYRMHKIVKKFENSIETTESLTGPVRRASTLSFINEYIGATVKRVRKDRYLGQVYNLSVENDESYTLSHVVHNCSIRDPYVDSFIDHTPYRKLFKHVHMPTIDSEPLKQEWIEQYGKADCLLTYSYFGKRVLEQQSGGKLKVAAVASPGADTKEFYPMDKKALRQQMGIREDAFIIQTVMRNQPRKLFPELFKAFAAFLARCQAEGNTDLAARSYLHIHSTHPDLGWNLPVEIRNYKLSHKVLWTYMCESCQCHEVSFFRGPETVCPHCTKPTYHLPNTAMGLSRPALAEIMNLPDVYVQYVSAGGWEMPVSDAKSCGVPVLVTDYSATSEQGHTPGGFAIPPATFGQEPYATSTGQIRAVSLDLNILVDKLYEYGTMSPDALREIGLAGRRLMEEVYDWSKIAKIWESVLDEVEIYDRNLTWYSAPQISSGHVDLPAGGTNQEFVKACFERILRANPDANVNEINRLAGILNQGYEVSSDQHGRTFRAPVNRQSLAQNIAAKVKSRNEAEHRRMMAVFGAAERGNRIEVVTL